MVERIASYRFSKRFKKEYNAFSKEIQKTFDKKLALFLDDTTHPSLSPCLPPLIAKVV